MFEADAIATTDEQRAIQCSAEQTVLVRANAGAAKTTTLALCAGQALHSGTSPEAIWALTYTEPAVEALQAALRKLGIPAATVKRMNVLSFDTLAQRVLRDAERQAVPQRISEESLAPVVRDALAELGRAEEPGGIEHFLRQSRWLKGSLALDMVRWQGEASISDVADALSLPAEELRLFTAYESLRYPKRDGVDRPLFRWTHDASYDLSCLLCDPDSHTRIDELALWPRSIGWLLLDEMHDLNVSLHALLVRLLQSNPQARFVGVGDVDQVVHAASGAEARFMAEDVDLGGRKLTVLPLTASHRFAASLAAVAHQIAAKPYASAAKHKTLVRTVSVAAAPYISEHEGDQRSSARGAHDAQQAAVLVDELLAWQKETRKPLSDAAILLRHAHHSIAIENALVERGIDYRTRGLAPYVQQPEVLLLRTLLAVASDDYQALRSRQTLAELVRSVVLFCGIELSFEEDSQESPEERLQTAIRYVQADPDMLRPFVEQQLLKRVEPHRARAMEKAIAVARTAMVIAQAAGSAGAGAASVGWFESFVQALDLRNWVESVFVNQQRRNDALAYCEGLSRAARQHQSPQAFFARLAQLESRLQEGLDSTRSAQKQAIRKAAGRKATVTLALAAEVKGLEYEHVLVPFVERGRFPDLAAGEAWQERNLFYVAITRARSRLTLFAQQGQESRFWLAARSIPGAQAGSNAEISGPPN